MKKRRRTTTKTNRPASKASGRRNPSSTSANAKNALLKRERDEALTREKATAEVLRVISASPGELKPVYEAILTNTVRICEAKFAAVYRFDGKAFNFEAEVNTPSKFAEFQRQRGPFQPTAGGLFERVLQTKLVTHIPPYFRSPLDRWRQVWGGRDPALACRCSRMMYSSVPFSSTGKRCAHSQTSRSS